MVLNTDEIKEENKVSTPDRSRSPVYKLSPNTRGRIIKESDERNDEWSKIM